MEKIQFSKEDLKKHAVFWFLIITYLSVFDPYPGTFIAQVILMSISILNYMISYYLISVFIFPRYKTRPIYLIASLFFALLFYYAISYFKNYHILVYLKCPSNVSNRPFYLFLIDSFMLFSIVAYSGSSFYFNNLRIQKLKIQNEKEKALLMKELTYFKNQFGAHVTFNFLNYCYSHVHKKSLKTAKAIELYSDMLRYSSDSIYESQVPLEKEIEYLNNYIGLRKLLSDEVFVEFEIKGGLKGKFISPRLLLTFVENAFKHGVYNDPKSPIEIEFNYIKNRLGFSVRNRINHNKNITSSGTGLKNAGQLLQHHYHEKHKLKLIETSGVFCCNLELILS
jgi:sensor histidine kinase YesM